MILNKLNNSNVKFTLKDDDNSNEYIEIIINNNIFKEFIITLIMLGNREKELKEPLTLREKEVLKYLMKGKTNSQIAKILKVSVHTTKAHIHNIYQKMAVQDRTQAVIKTIKYNLIEF